MIKTILWPVRKTADISIDIKHWLDNLSERWETQWFDNPLSASWLSWKKIAATNKERSPIRFWITDTAIPAVADVFGGIEEACWAILHRHHPDHQYNIIRTSLKPGCYEVDTLLLEACKTLIKSYVEGNEHGVQKLNEKIKWFEDNEKENTVLQVSNYRDALKVYHWLTVDREVLLKSIDTLMAERFGEDIGFELLDFMGNDRETEDHPDRAKYDAWCEGRDDDSLIHELEKYLYDGDSEAMKLMVDIRSGLWD